MPSEFNPVDYLVVGHVTEDITPEGIILGGTATYSGLTAQAFGKSVGILTSTASDTDLDPLGEIQVQCVPSRATTTFQNVYTSAGRRQVISARAAALAIEAMPAEWSRIKTLHCGPVADEVDLAFCKLPGEHSLCMTPQGWLRSWDDQGNVSVESWPRLRPYFVQRPIVVLSLEDIGGSLEPADDIARECHVLAITLGPEGVAIYANQEARKIAAPVVNEIDTTGCGDIFAAAFFICLEEGDDPWTAAAIANQLGSIAATREGLASIPRPAEVAEALRLRSA